MPEISETNEMMAHPIWCDALRGDDARTEVRDGGYVREAPAETDQEHRGHVCHVDANSHFTYRVRGALVQSWEPFNGARLDHVPQVELYVTDRDFEPEVTVYLNAQEARRTAEMLLHLADRLDQEAGRGPGCDRSEAVVRAFELGYRAGQGDGQRKAAQEV